MAGGGAAESEGLNEGALHKKRRLVKERVGRRKIVPIARRLPRRRCRYGELSDETELPEPSPLPSPPLPLSPPPPFPAILWLPSHSSSAIGASLASSSCALVGGGHGLMDSLLGAQIDRHDYVIRVNRGLDASLPLHQTLAPHLGLRQDVLFIDQCEHNSPLYSYRLVGTDNFVSCAASPPHAEDCHFGAIVYRGNSERWEPVCSGESQHEPPLHRKARHGYVAVGIETDLVTNAVLSIRGFERHGSSVERKPTTGFHAVLVFGLLCRSLHLYGFEGEATVDGHEITADHEIEEEHRLLRKLSRHEEIPEMPPAIRQAWEQANLTIWC
ncbi:hypothetical protein AB1Y20_010332 [Prymnesium parvum]|uniref:Uncharacterized protein n=1 Tax=Prymnesium parvum TaxID=97485 RepID=A0AB34K447_PRYPA